LPAALAHADLVVSATGAVGTVVAEDAVHDALGRRDRPLVFLDLAVPRDVEPAVADLANVTLIDIATLRDRLAEHDEQTAAGILAAQAIVDEEVHRYVVRRRSDALAPIIRALYSRGDEIMRTELDRFGSRLAALTPDEREAVESLARGIVAKLLHDPIVELKERAEPGTQNAHAKLLADLLGIDLDA
jgi:glutamyl-tRNA reductase